MSNPSPDSLLPAADGGNAVLLTYPELFLVGAAVLVMSIFLWAIVSISRNKRDLDPYHLTRMVSVVLIVGSVLMLEGMGYSQVQLAPLLGLLAIIAGHMLSPRTLPCPSKHDSDDAPPPPSPSPSSSSSSSSSSSPKGNPTADGR
ncbi:hypothetical protein [Phaeospirillum tilakii]|uniref:Uncharacterized protein n=1 Tax=Phaeospirillum tilakii TaxID=741673 RepID=A0ABW5C7K2_9PROT